MGWRSMKDCASSIRFAWRADHGQMIKAASFSRSRKISMLWPAPLKGFLGVDWETPETIGAAAIAG